MTLKYSTGSEPWDANMAPTNAKCLELGWSDILMLNHMDVGAIEARQGFLLVALLQRGNCSSSTLVLLAGHVSFC